MSITQTDLLKSGTAILARKYKGYTAVIDFSREDDVFHGKIGFISDMITFEANTIKELEREFHKAVDDYFITCEEIGKKPDMPKWGDQI